MSGETSDELRLLREGEIRVEGRLVDASNATLFAEVSLDGMSAACVYKPRAGERPLWDFPDGTLAHREVAAYELSEAAGWEVVPPTVLRDGPFGPGMCQLWIHVDDTAEPLVDVVRRGRLPRGWLRVLDALGAGGAPVTLAHADDAQLRRMALFDAVVNNADRKGGHVLVDASGDVRGVDHGVCFSVDEKLRTVLWGWSGAQLDTAELDTLTRLRAALDGPLGHRLGGLLEPAEVRATMARVDRLLAEGVLPYPAEGWPAIPWPPF